MKYTKKDHTFAICAYKESRFLEECIHSLMNQSKGTNIIMVTSTPNQYIEEMSAKYNIPLFVREGKSDIADDWNFAYSMADTPLMTIAHQDDIYEPDYAERIISAINHFEKPLIAFSDYAELRNGQKTIDRKILRIKRLMLKPLKTKNNQTSKFIRRRILSMGSPICCPSVTFVKNNLPSKIFKSQYRSDVDWQAWEKLSRLEGAFVYCAKPLMCHRIHEESATTAIIADSDRSKEDLEMFKLFWPTPIAKGIEHFYKKSENSNNLS